MPAISNESFFIPVDRLGNELEDIRTSEQNKIAAEFIFSLVRKLASDQKKCLHCSIAGGRKTMNFYLASALQFFGRPQDRLYHVLVPSNLESSPDFYFPNNGPRKNEEKAIDLAELPFLRLKGIVFKYPETVEELFKFGQNTLDR